MPQLDLVSFPSVALTFTVGFILTVYISYVYIYPKIALILKFRDKVNAKGLNVSGAITKEGKGAENTSNLDIFKENLSSAFKK
jgi:hypothetical protein